MLLSKTRLTGIEKKCEWMKRKAKSRKTSLMDLPVLPLRLNRLNATGIKLNLYTNVTREVNVRH